MGIGGFPTIEETQERFKAEATVAEADRAIRTNSVMNAIAITEMEGGRPSDYCREQLALFETGEISVTEMRDRVVRNASR